MGARETLAGNRGRTCLLVLMLIFFSASAQGQKDFSFTANELIEDAFGWLAGPNNRDLIHVYKLSCPKCVGEIKQAFNENPDHQGLIYFTTSQQNDRLIAQALLASTLSHKDQSERMDTFGELLNLFANSPEQFLSNPEEWRSLALSFWNFDQYALEDPEPWADALNWMDRQNRTLALLNKTSYPAKIALQEQVSIPEVEKNTFRDQFLFATLALPWLKYPEELSSRGRVAGSLFPDFPKVTVQPVRQYGFLEWNNFAKTAATGAYWQFFGGADVTMHPRLLEFLALFLELPTDRDRQAAFAEALRKIAQDTQQGRPRSILIALPRVQFDLSIPEERRARRMDEARQMMEQFQIYEGMRG